MVGTCLLSKGNPLFAIIHNPPWVKMKKDMLYSLENFWQQSEIFTSIFLKLEFWTCNMLVSLQQLVWQKKNKFKTSVQTVEPC